MTSGLSTHPSSFRDRDGFLFYDAGVLYRQVNQSYQASYEKLMQSGLYQEFTKAGWLNPHEETDHPGKEERLRYRVLRPRPVPFVSYPYEWSFSQLKDAALLTLKLQQKALGRGMNLKDASAFNIQWDRGRPTFIDTLSFERYEEGKPWVAYGQFCRHFLAPLAMMAYGDSRVNRLSQSFLDGIPLEIASRSLPLRTRLNFGLFLHLHWHARSGNRAINPVLRKGRVSLTALRGLVESLEGTVRGLKRRMRGTVWTDYYGKEHNYGNEDLNFKKKTIETYLETEKPKKVLDLGANTGVFSRLASRKGIFTVSCDFDPECVEINYLNLLRERDEFLLPLVVDLTSPSPAIGWNLKERASFVERSSADMVLALALVHHLAIGNNVPLSRIAEFFKGLGKALLVEFVPKEDPQVKRLLSLRRDIFKDYGRAAFEEAFKEYFSLEAAHPVGNSGRILYHMRAF